ncbi:hypothetical protein C8J57DRAFT_1492921 [Mycena rebaudengoi]|nr:hypothetical protein C8J57DRAFT_1492921 [Mycena rebaudengoi]
MPISNPRLPPELECEIFEIAARSCREDLEPGLTLQLVARRVHVWVERVFLEVVALRDGRHAEKFLQLVDLKPAGFFANIVRALFIPYLVTSKTASKVLSVCTGVRFLACWAVFQDTPELPLQISRLPLSRLGIELHHFLSIPLSTSAWLSKLTHLDLAFWSQFDDPSDLLALCRHLPQLTRIYMYHYELEWSLHLARQLCSSCPALRAVHIEVDGYGEGVDENPRIVWKPQRKYFNNDHIREWSNKTLDLRLSLSFHYILHGPLQLSQRATGLNKSPSAPTSPRIILWTSVSAPVPTPQANVDVPPDTKSIEYFSCRPDYCAPPSLCRMT